VSATFDVSDIDELLALMEHWGIAEMHLTVDDATVDLVRATPEVVETEISTAEAVVMGAPAPIAQAVMEEPELLTIYAPAVGVFHLAHRGFPHKTPHAGDQVQAGQIIGTIELMHVPNDLVSPVSGTIEAILTDDGAGVEYGQPLMVIRPFEEVSEHEAGMLPPPTR